MATRTSWGFKGEVYGTPAVSPDGQTIAFSTLASTLSPATYYDLFAVDIHGGGLRQLSMNEGQDWYPRWSPDGAEIYYVVFGGLNPAVYRRPPQGAAHSSSRSPSICTVSMCRGR